MSASTEVFLRNLRNVEGKDLDAAVAAYAPDAVFSDPHYPYPRMVGTAQIRDGLAWAFQGMESFSFTPTTIAESPDGTIIAEVESHHVMRGGRSLDFSQVFVVEVADGLVTRWTAYEPYGPNGVAGIFLGLGKLSHRMKRRGQFSRPLSRASS